MGSDGLHAAGMVPVDCVEVGWLEVLPRVVSVLWSGSCVYIVTESEVNFTFHSTEMECFSGQ
jgi:hypothetical protein